MSKSKQQQAIEKAASEKIEQPLSDRIFRLLLWTAVAIAAVSMLVTVVMFYTEFLDISREGASATHSLLKYVAVYLVLISAVTLVIARVVKQYTDRHLAEPINRISSAAKEYILDKSDGTLDDMTHFKDLHLDTDDELEHLALVLRDMEVSMVQYVENLTKVTREKERISTELDLAQRIQENMLPNVFPPYPDRHDLDIHASMDPAKEVGGDFYDFFLIDHDHLGLVMADVAGKGIPAALFMMMARIMINYSAKTGVPPAEVLRRVNERICENNEAEMFVTVWFGILELSSGRLKAANAGHEYPVLKRPDGTFEKLKDKHGLVLGAIDGARYKEYEIMLEKGTKLFQYTDGIPEATNTDDEMFGMERMIEALNEGPDATPEELLVNVREAVRVFVGDAQQFDDMTMLCVEYKGK